MQEKNEFDCIVAYITLINVYRYLLILCFSTIVMLIIVLADAILKYWHFNTNIVVFFNRLLCIFVIIAQVTLEQLYLTVTIFVFVQQFLIFACIVAKGRHKLRLFMNLLVFLEKHVIFSCEFTFVIILLVCKNSLFSYRLIPELGFECGCYAPLTLYFVVVLLCSISPRLPCCFKR